MKHPIEITTVRAPVDKLIVPVVQALLAFPEVATLYSCQGVSRSQENGKDWNFERDASYVIFMVGDGSAVELAVFLDFLMERTRSLDCYIRFELTIIPEPPGSGAPQIELRFQQENLSKVVEWLHLAREGWLGLAVELRRLLTKFQ